MDWARILAYVTGRVDQGLLARNEYLAAENRILKAQLKGRLELSDAERATLGEVGHRLGRKVLGEVATVARPDTILAWYRKLVARKFDGSKARQGPGRPRVKREVEQLIVRMASENRTGAMTDCGRLGQSRMRFPIKRLAMFCNARLCRRRRSASARPNGRPSFGPTWRCWRDRLFHGGGADAARAGDLLRIVFIHLESRRVDIAGSRYPDEPWMKQIARNVTMERCGTLGIVVISCMIGTTNTQSFRAIIASGRVEPLALPARSPN